MSTESNQLLFDYSLNVALQARRLAHACSQLDEQTAYVHLMMRAQKEIRLARRYYNRLKADKGSAAHAARIAAIEAASQARIAAILQRSRNEGEERYEI